MNHVDFLPPSYRRRQRRIARTYRQVALVAVAATLLGFWAVALEANHYGQRKLAEQLESSVQAKADRLTVLARMDRTYAALTRQSEVYRELSQPVSYTQVLGVLATLLPDEVAVTDLLLESVRPTPRKASDKPDKKAAKTKVKQDDFIRVELEALAPDDLSVATFVSELDANPLFSGVKMRSSRSVETRGVYARQFRLTALVDLDRDFEWTDRQEVARAD